jgi:hypothetical protein
MSGFDYYFLFAFLILFGGLFVLSKRVRTIVQQCLLHPTQNGYLAIWEDDVSYVEGEPPTQIAISPESPADGNRGLPPLPAKPPEAEKDATQKAS